MELHLRYNYWPKSEKSAKKAKNKAKNQNGGNENFLKVGPKTDRFDGEKLNQTNIRSILLLLHNVGIHLWYHSWPKLEKSAKIMTKIPSVKKWVKEENHNGQHEIWTKLVIRQVPNVPKAIQDFNEGFKEVKVGF